jgi:hypothetical protein
MRVSWSAKYAQMKLTHLDEAKGQFDEALKMLVQYS